MYVVTVRTFSSTASMCAVWIGAYNEFWTVKEVCFGSFSLKALMNAHPFFWLALFCGELRLERLGIHMFAC